MRRTDAEIVIEKSPMDIATGTDIAVEDAVRRVLKTGYPSYPIVGEERGDDPNPDGTAYWLVDPLCGTQTYSCQIPAYASNIALVENGRVSLSAVFDGANGRVYAAEREGGAFMLDGDPWTPISAKLGTVVSLELAGKPMFGGDPLALGSLFASLVAGRRWHVRMLGTTLSLARVATGDFAGMFLLGRVSSPLHTAAGCLLAEEAGARVTDPQGNPWDLSTTQFVVAATRALHEEFLALYRQAFG